MLDFDLSNMIDCSSPLGRGDLLRRIGRAAKSKKLTWEMEGEGKKHEIWRCGSTKFPVRRAAKSKKLTAEAILKGLENELAKDWWEK